MKKLLPSIFFLFTISLHAEMPAKKIGGGKIGETAYFEFHSSYLVNLHHFLYKQGIKFNKATADQKQFEKLFKEEVTTWVDEKTKEEVMKAVRFYADSMISKNLLFDESMTNIKYTLQQCNTFKDVHTQLPAAVADALESADNFYRTFIWSAQNRANRAFAATNMESVRKIENEVMAQFKKYYQYQYNEKKFRIDLVDYATFYGGYTSAEPYVSATISSTDKRHEGTQGVELVFHEVSHAMIDSIFTVQQNICSASNIPFDHNTWHTILFYSTGTIVKNALTKQGIAHELYMYKNKLGDLHPAVKRTIDTVSTNWQFYLDGKVDMQEAMKIILASGNVN